MRKWVVLSLLLGVACGVRAFDVGDQVDAGGAGGGSGDSDGGTGGGGGNPEPCVSRTRSGTCSAEADWHSTATLDCADAGRLPTNFVLTGACDGGKYSGATYRCCLPDAG